MINVDFAAVEMILSSRIILIIDFAVVKMILP